VWNAARRRGFDATITLNDHHLAMAGLIDRKAEAVAVARLSRIETNRQLERRITVVRRQHPGAIICSQTAKKAGSSPASMQSLR
jgi:hypothetical protein